MAPRLRCGRAGVHGTGRKHSPEQLRLRAGRRAQIQLGAVASAREPGQRDNWAPVPDTIERLVSWIEAAGGHVRATCIVGEGDRRSTLLARDVRPGEPILQVPSACILTPERAAETTVGQRIVSDWNGAALDPILLASFLIIAEREGDPWWAPYIATLPRRLGGHPMFFSQADLDALAGTMLLQLVEERRYRLLEECEWLRDYIPELASLEPDDWVFVRALTTSRCFGLGKFSTDTLVPFADLCNHARFADTHWGLAPDGRSFALRAEEPLEAGSEVHVSYGAKSNSRLFLHYGFTLAHNPIEDVVFDLGEFGDFDLAPNDESPAMLAMLKQVAATGPDRGRKRHAYAGVGTAARERLGRLPPPQSTEGSTENIRNALHIRESERRILEWWVRRCQEYA